MRKYTNTHEEKVFFFATAFPISYTLHIPFIPLRMATIANKGKSQRGFPKGVHKKASKCVCLEVFSVAYSFCLWVG